jgi:two-component system response regulator GlrR
VKPSSFLLLNYNAANNFDRALYKILTTTLNPKVQSRQETLQSYQTKRGLKELERVITRSHPDLIFFMLTPHPHKLICGLLQTLERELNAPPVIVVTEKGEPSDLLELLESGATDYITPPMTALNIYPRIRRLLTQARSEATHLNKLKDKFALRQLVGESSAFRSIVKTIRTVARCDVNVLISGETGTGKELCARAIHYLSPRASRAFIPVNCGAIPVDLVENELFGHSRGAYTTAVDAQPGLIDVANGGTLFLDEIDCLFPPAQVKLLRFLQEKEYRPLGSTKIRSADVRVIAAANTDFDKAIKAGRLRQDLYYRLNVVPLKLPPLRERRQDILLLAKHFLQKYAAEFGKSAVTFSDEAMDLLVSHDWVGNVREIENVVERAVVLSEKENIAARDLCLPTQSKNPKDRESFQEAKAQCVAAFERAFIQDCLINSQGNITQAAKAAQKDRRSFWELIRKYRIDASNFKTNNSENNRFY